MFRSFRFRLVALSMLVSALALLAFSGVAWMLIVENQRERFRYELENLASRYAPRLVNVANRPPGMETVRAMEILAQLEDDVPLYAVVAADGKVLLQSAGWPVGFAPADFAKYALPMAPNPGLSEERPPGGEPAFQAAPGPEGPPPAYDNPRVQRAPRPGDDPFEAPNQRGQFRGGRRGQPGQPGGGRGPQGPRPLNLRHDLTEYLALPANRPLWSVAVVPMPGGVAVVGLPLDTLRQERREVRNVFLVALPVALALVGLGSAWLAGRAVAPVKKLSAAAERVTAEGLHERIPAEGEQAEFARLISVFNSMLDRLGRSFDQARRFSHDAAHELNTPLTVLMGQIDQALHAAPTGSLEQQRWALLADEVQRLRDIVRKLLTLARADRGALRPDLRPLDLARLARDCADDAAAGAAGLDFSTGGEESLPAEGDAALLRQSLYNLLSNATKYNRPGGFVRVQCARATHDGRDWAVVDVTNAGPAISTEHVPYLFERFFRGDPSRTRDIEGLGLGLSLAREFARAHGGDLHLAKNAPDAITFRLEIPIRTAADKL